MSRPLSTDVYDADGRLSAQVAFNASGNWVAPQETMYLYQSPLDGSLQTAENLSRLHHSALGRAKRQLAGPVRRHGRRQRWPTATFTPPANGYT